MSRVVITAVAGFALVMAGDLVWRGPLSPAVEPGIPAAVPAPRPTHPPDISAATLTDVVKRYCHVCHNAQLLTGNLSLAGFDVAAAEQSPETAEKMIRKLRAGMMPPPGIPRPKGDTLQALVETLERIVDQAAVAHPNPGARTFQRLNRAEYQRSVQELLGLEIDAGDYLPLDTKSANFDNIADVQTLSPTLLGAYLSAAAEVSRLAVGDAEAVSTDRTYSVSSYVSQQNHVEGTPHGTRGGISVVHNFPADGEYVFSMAFHHTTSGGYVGSTARFEQIELSINGERAALLRMNLGMQVYDPEGISMHTDPIFVRAGPQRVSAAFIEKSEGPVVDLIAPHEWTMSDTWIGNGGYGLTVIPHLRDLVISGPSKVTGVSETPSRKRIFTCRPVTASEARPCAESIVGRLASEAFRKPVSAEELGGVMKLYDGFAAENGFEYGIRRTLQAILASPRFVFRLETAPEDARAGEGYRISDLNLASRLSFLLWGTPPDAQLLSLAQGGKLSDTRTLEQEVRRMLADPRSEALATRFAAQWLRLQDLDKVRPDVFWFPDYDQQLAAAMHRETELFFDNLVREDRSFLDLFNADYTFVNERLARHYGIKNVVGPQFQRVTYPDDRRRGILGHGSVLVLTSHANRTSPVLRGKWVMEVLLGTPPPPPPPGVPDLAQTGEVKDGRLLTTRERMEIHREAAACRSCHQFMDPVGLALDNFDVTGKWRIREKGSPLDTRGTYYDGTAVESPHDLRQVLLKRPEPLVRTFTENLMVYALGRRTEYYDNATIRAIARDAAANDYRMSSFILGVVKSDAFRMKRAEVVTAEAGDRRQN